MLVLLLLLLFTSCCSPAPCLFIFLFSLTPLSPSLTRTLSLSLPLFLITLSRSLTQLSHLQLKRRLLSLLLTHFTPPSDSSFFLASSILFYILSSFSTITASSLAHPSTRFSLSSFFPRSHSIPLSSSIHRLHVRPTPGRVCLLALLSFLPSPPLILSPGFLAPVHTFLLVQPHPTG